MALITCKDCKKEFSNDARRCLHCGARKPVGNGRWLLLTLGALFGLPFMMDKNPPASPGCETNWKLCKDNNDLVNHYNNWLHAQVACQLAAEQSARYGTPEFPRLSFGTFHKGRDYVDTGIAYAYENDAKFQNGFGAMVHSIAECKYDLNSDKVINLVVTPKF